MGFYYPEDSFHELDKYRNLVIRKSGLSETDYITLLRRIMFHISLVPSFITQSKLNEASQLMGQRDPNDVVFLAAALILGDCIIWSDDNDFNEQQVVPVLKTKDVVEEYKKMKGI